MFSPKSCFLCGRLISSCLRLTVDDYSGKGNRLLLWHTNARTYPRTYSPTHPRTQPITSVTKPIHCVTHSLTHPHIRSVTSHLPINFTHSPKDLPPTHSSTRAPSPFTPTHHPQTSYSPISPLAHPPIHSSIHLVNHLFIY